MLSQKTLFVAGDPGGSRCLLPLIEFLHDTGAGYSVLDNGFLAKELPSVSKENICNCVDITYSDYSCLYFGSSATDAFPLMVARDASLHMPTVHVLDNWSTYKKRMETDGLETFFPTYYAVMDTVAAQGVKDAGFPDSSVVITGHPALSCHLPNPTGAKFSAKKTILFINEPYSAVLGADTNSANHCGFLEQDVLKAFADSMQKYAEQVYVVVVPHPKDDPEIVKIFWSAVAGKLEGHVQPLLPPRDVFSSVCGVAGMASIVLYEAWLLGLPVLAMQPDCKMESMAHFKARSGCVYCEKFDLFTRDIDAWWDLCLDFQILVPRPEWKQHQQATQRLLQLK